MKKKCKKCPYEEGIAVFEGWRVTCWCFAVLLVFEMVTSIFPFWLMIVLTLVFSVLLGIMLHSMKFKGCPKKWKKKIKKK